MKKLILLFFALTSSVLGLAQSTSPNPQILPVAPGGIAGSVNSDPNASDVITFSEYSLGTPIRDQYKNIGVIFGGSGAFISLDGANPTAPVLSGTPRFQGSISGTFVRPGTDEPTIVESFRLDAGYFDEFGSTRIEWFDPDGKKLGQRINSILGIETIEITGGNIASWSISIVANEPAGFAIDNVSFVPVTTSVLFREKSENGKDGSWAAFGDDIPGFDHVGFHFDDQVFESHPGYIFENDPVTVFYSEDGQESIAYDHENGVQSQFTLETFRHASDVPGVTTVILNEEVPIDRMLAQGMKTAINSVSEASFHYLGATISEKIVKLKPSLQKGGPNNDAFTCVGLIEWAAEQAGHNGGQGFIPNENESFTVGIGPASFEVPLLSPELLNNAMKNESLWQDAKQWVQGFFDPVDFVITDPLGRRIGHIEGEGTYNEIPNAFYSGNGDIEQVLIPTAIPGTYTIRYVGLGDSVFAAIASKDNTIGFFDSMLAGEEVGQVLFVQPKQGSMGDVDNDADVDTDDITALNALLNTFTDGLDHPGDLDGDGLLSPVDVVLLTQLVGELSGCQAGCPDLVMDFKNAENGPNYLTNPSIKPIFRLHNTGTTAIDLSKVSAKYWFTMDTPGTVSVSCLSSGAGCSAVDASYQSLTPAAIGADAYVELSFNSGSLAPGAKMNTKLRILRQDGLGFDESDDHSFTGLTPDHVDNLNVSLYYDGQLIQGIEPVSALSRRSQEELADKSWNLTVSPNPFTEGFLIVQDEQPASLVEYRLLNLLGEEVYRTQSQAKVVKINRADLLPGMYLLQVIQPSGVQTIRVMKTN